MQHIIYGKKGTMKKYIVLLCIFNTMLYANPQWPLEDRWIAAAINGKINKLQSFLKRGLSLETKNYYGRTALYYASEYGHFAAVEFLVQQGAKINERHLAIALEKSHLTIAKFLVGRGSVSISIKDLDMVIQHGDLDLLKYFCEHGGNIHAKSDNGKSLLHCAAESGHIHIIQFLLDNRLAVNETYKVCSHWDEDQRTTPLLEALKSKKFDAAQMLIEHGATIDYSGTHKKQSPLHIAVAKGDLATVELLLKKGAKINIKSEHNNNRTELLVALSKGHLTIADLLLEHDADVQAKSDNGFTAMHYAASIGATDFIKKLKDRGADINACTSVRYQLHPKNETPLHFAVEEGYDDTVEALLECGANTDETCGYETSVRNDSFFDEDSLLENPGKIDNTVITIALSAKKPSIICNKKDRDEFNRRERIITLLEKYSEKS